jgi:LmbE family N-acetylglucosaminyl deacetylase
MEELPGPRPAKNGKVPVSGAGPTEPVGVWTRATDVCYRVLVARARDLTLSTGGRSALVLAPHPDDETFGCAATILRKRAAGAQVSIFVVSDGGAFNVEEMSRDELVAAREDNVREATRRLGVPSDDLHLLGYPDLKLRELVDSMTSRFAAIFKELDPDEIYIPSSIDFHPDHVAVHTASLRAVERSVSHASLYTYPVWFWSRKSWSVSGESTLRRKLLLSRVFVAAIRGLRPVKVRTEGHLETKRELMDIYGLELEPDYDFFEKWHLRDEELFFATSTHTRGRT